MKVRAVKDYPDGELRETVKKGHEWDVSDERAKVLIEAGVAEAVGSRRLAAMEGE